MLCRFTLLVAAGVGRRVLEDPGIADLIEVSEMDIELASDSGNRISSALWITGLGAARAFGLKSRAPCASAEESSGARPSMFNASRFLSGCLLRVTRG